MSLRDYISKEKLLVAVISALLTGIVMYAANMYLLIQELQFAQNKEFLASLRADITLLKKVERELDENLNLLLNQNYQTKFEVRNIPLPFDDESEEDPKSREFFEAVIARNMQVLTSVKRPTELFLVDIWPRGGPAITEINFELTQEIDEFYRKLGLVNNVVREIRYISVGDMIPEGGLMYTKEQAQKMEEIVTDITKDSIVNLKNKVAKEIQKLREERKKLQK